MSSTGIPARVFRGDKSGRVTQSDVTLLSSESLPADCVHIEPTHCGLCGTDLHYMGSGCVLGHEPVGIVREVGSTCQRIKVGDRVGWGYYHDSCGACIECLQGRENLCPNNKPYGVSDLDMGGLGSAFVIKETFTIKVPDAISSADAAPLFCAGVTVFSPFYKLNIRPTDSIGVIGIGGLGHLALQIGNKWGCHVTAFTRSSSKEAEAKQHGAHSVVIVGPDASPDVKPQDEEKVDFLLACSSEQVDWSLYTPYLSPGGQLIVMGVSDLPNFTVPYRTVLMQELAVRGILGASRLTLIKCLEFCARHGIRPQVEEVEGTEQKINEAFERLKKGDVRYRFVVNLKPDSS